ncbi:dihydroorotase [Synechococcus sp. RSCCF101]|nr:dihydroorotase [Synechococcus sp. RSCCF101]
MPESVLLRGVSVLRDPHRSPEPEDVLLEGERLVALGEGAAEQGRRMGLAPRPAAGCLLAPCLVDPHSVLERPRDGVEETLDSLLRSAAAAGYGQVGLLPRAASWRDRPDRLLQHHEHPVRLHCWGGFSLDGAGRDLAPHRDLLGAGVVGLADDLVLPDPALLDRGLLLGEMGEAPLLLAPRDPSLSAGGFVREGIESIRAGWPTDPAVSELLPLRTLLTLAEVHPSRRLVPMHLSTQAGVTLLAPAVEAGHCRAATAHWWSLVRDTSLLAPADEGWTLVPSLGGPGDRQALIDALRRGVITAVAVSHEPLDAEEQGLPPDQRRPGLAGHRFVLPMLWEALVRQRGWSVSELWQALSWGPSALIGREPEQLLEGSNRWLLFDPAHRWIPRQQDPDSCLAANQPLLDQPLLGRVVGCGLAGGLRVVPERLGAGDP